MSTEGWSIHLAQFVLAPIANLIATEASAKLDADVSVDVMKPLVTYDAGGHARAVATMVEALARAKEAGVDAQEALRLVT